uniref:Uncharacterized protein n=1 Tax=Rhizophora mucronata TaxID=61149 RepID=A0A2P2KA94_RHIMU
MHLSFTNRIFCLRYVQQNLFAQGCRNLAFEPAVQGIDQKY